MKTSIKSLCVATFSCKAITVLLIGLLTLGNMMFPIPVGVSHLSRVEADSSKSDLSAPLNDYVVTEIVDSGDRDTSDGICDYSSSFGEQCSLRAAIEQANASGGGTINFDIPSTRPEIFVSAQRGPMEITSAIVIDGTTQPQGKVVIRESSCCVDAAFLVTGGSTTIKGLVINRFSDHGIILQGAGDNIIEDNYFGTDATGMNMYDQYNDPIGMGEYGVLIDGSSNNTVQINLISGNSTSSNDGGGVKIVGENATGNQILHNNIGMNLDEVFDLSSSYYQSKGIYIDGAPGNTVEGNAISWNIRGIEISGTTASGTTIQNNFIGTGEDGLVCQTNTQDGIYIDDAPSTIIAGNILACNRNAGIVLKGSAATGTWIEDNKIGTTITAIDNAGNKIGIDCANASNGSSIKNNTIAFSTQNGLSIFRSHDNVVEGNSIFSNNYSGILLTGDESTYNQVGENQIYSNNAGITVQGFDNTISSNTIHSNQVGIHVSNGTGHRLFRNSIYDNTNLGIDLGAWVADGATNNDPGDADTGPNNLQNFPLIIEQADGSLGGELDSAPSTDFTIEFFSNSGCHSSGFGEGKSYLGTVDITTDAQGKATFSIPFSAGGGILTATATDPDGNTSEFSRCPATDDIIVNTTDDDEDLDLTDGVCDIDDTQEGNQCSLRAAIQTANSPANAGDDRIIFDLGTGTPSITPNSNLPPITEDLTINGYEGEAARIDIIGEHSEFGSAGLDIQSENVNIYGLGITQFIGPGILVNNVPNVTIGNPEFGDNTLWNNDSGIKITGKSAKNIKIQGNLIGVDPNKDEFTLATNLQAGIVVADGATEVLIGGREDWEDNKIYNGVRVTGSETNKITVQNNTLGVRSLNGIRGFLQLPLDLGLLGPECNPWQGGQGTNDGIAPPRILNLIDIVVEGITIPGGTVDVYRVTAVGTNRGRYFAQTMEPIAYGTADESSGAFSIDIDLNIGDQVVLTVTNEDGSTSEPSQLRRPLVFVPGFGGSTLVADDGTELWLPDGATDGTQNYNLFRMKSDNFGNSYEPVHVTGVLEYVGYGYASRNVIYGPSLKWLDDIGYPGDRSNQNTLEIDLWRYPYDWRLAVEGNVAGLQALIERVTAKTEDIACSCEVDLVGHSMGGLVSSLYIKNNPVHSRDHVHRFVSVATPYLGTPKTSAAFSVGYLFELEHTHIYGWFYDIDWNLMYGMTRNMTGAYALMPSRKYWNASIRSGGFYMSDLHGNRLTSYDQTLDFLQKPKADASGNPLGLARNGNLMLQEQQNVHDIIDDWTGWQGPPHIFRIVGDRSLSTPVAWILGQRPDFSGGIREETGDTPFHFRWRNNLAPVLGSGDETVSLSSATLGHDPGIGVDYSGITSPWIEDFEYFPCTHFGIITDDCTRQLRGLPYGSLESVVENLETGYMVRRGTENAFKFSNDNENDVTQEVIYIVSSVPVAVHIEDSYSNHTGAIHPDSLNTIENTVPNIGYWRNDGVTVLSLERGETYDITVETPQSPATVQVFRVVPESVENNMQLIFPEQELAIYGSMTWTVDESIGKNSGIDVDANGDGSYEATATAAATLSTGSAAPAIPAPEPFFVEVQALTSDTQDQQAVVVLPDVEGPLWEWEVSSDAAWIVPDATFGQTPADITLDIASTTLPVGSYSGQLEITLSYDGYQQIYPVDVELNVAESLSLTFLEIDPNQVSLLPGETMQFSAFGYDQFGDPFTISPTWSATGGTIETNGLYVAGNASGLFEVIAEDPITGLRSMAAVQIASGVSVDDPFDVLPMSNRLYQNYPNPFNPETVITYDVASPSHVTLDVYNVLGRQVDTVVDRYHESGRYQAIFNTGGLPSGFYFYRIRMGTFHEAKKMILLK